MTKIKEKQRVTKETTAGEEIIGALKDALESALAGEPPEKRFTARTVELPDRPGAWGAADVLRLRLEIGASQVFFAGLIGCSPSTIQAWEQGKRVPDGTTRRLLDLIKANPRPWVLMAGGGGRVSGKTAGAEAIPRR